MVEASRGAPPRPAIGAVITLRAGSQTWSRSVRRGGSYLSSSPPTAHFGLGELERYDAIEVAWPDGSKESFGGGEVNREVSLAQGEGSEGR